MSLVYRLLLVVILRYTRWQNIEKLIYNNLFQRNSELRCAYEGKPFEDLDSAQLYLKVQFKVIKTSQSLLYRDVLILCF